MPLDYAATSALISNQAFQGRVQVACLHFANYIAGEAADVPAHVTRLKWAGQTFASPMQSAMQITPTVVMDPSVQADGEAITDANLQTAVEVAINKVM